LGVEAPIPMGGAWKGKVERGNPVVRTARAGAAQAHQVVPGLRCSPQEMRPNEAARVCHE
jgi:hypothetical protein